MANVTIKGIDEDLLHKIRESAKRNRRSLNKEIIFQLEQVMTSKPLSYAEIKEIRSRRSYKANGVLTDEQIQIAIESERS